MWLSCSLQALTSNTDYDSFWAANKPNANSYAAYIKGGAAAWSSEGFPLGESAVERITNGEIKGIMADGDKLYTVYGLKVENGALVVCIDLNGICRFRQGKDRCRAYAVLRRYTLQYNADELFGRTQHRNSDGRRYLAAGTGQ